ncbi:ATP-dependent Clp protease proteolytic subunit [Bacteroides pyogenes JCM 6292]|uniref:ATP-dependent Clp protease proteolytic subunit n=1 Tax=Bacteroides pyogenes JCM 6292 TaxID=1235809 RepID=W4P5R5_9BACE|nr:ATP-dependent Clp protease proteolytic subunit [Bacteroides pyogenes JCM 6292]
MILNIKLSENTEFLYNYNSVFFCVSVFFFVSLHSQFCESMFSQASVARFGNRQVGFRPFIKRFYYLNKERIYNMDDFRKYATKHLGMNGMVLDDVIRSQAGYLNPYILEERQLNVTQLDVFSRLMMDRIIFLGTAIDDYTANTLQAQLLYLDSVDQGKDISIYINSPGGSVYAGLGIYDTMQFISSNVATICTGMAASMAAVLLVAGTEGKRSALPHSRVMIHQPMGGAQGQASDIEITAREIQKMKKELYTIIAEHSHTDFDKVWADSDRDYWMTAQEAKDYGMVDEVLIKK